MTQFIAAWAPPNRALDHDVINGLKAALGPAGVIDFVSTARVAVACWDSKLWPGPSMHAAAPASVVVAGDPVVVLGDRTLGRHDAVAFLGRQLLDPLGDAPCSAEGSYAAMAWSESGAAVAVTDKLGVRPLYWARSGGTVFVSTVLWAMARVPGLKFTPDLRAAVETSTFGAPLADRTLMSEVRALGAGELLDLTGDAPAIRRYHDWAALAPNGVPADELPAYIGHAFDQAVASRTCGQPRVFAFLSGGMDSRLVVSRLRQQDVDVYAMNFAPPGSQDLLFGQMAAQAMDVKLFEFDDDGTTFLDRRGRAFEAWRHDPEVASLTFPQDRLVWSGDGGSVGLGHVYLDEKIVAMARQGSIEDTAREIQRANRYVVSPWSFSVRHRDVVDWPLRGIQEDLASRTGVEPARNAHLFFMLNDQRRHLAAHYESLHQTRLDMVLPFFDGRFLKAVLSSPVDPFLLHRLYNRLMELQPFGLGGVPWQVYPGHEACPVHDQGHARLQWQEGWFEAASTRRALRARMRQALRETLSARFPSDVLNRGALFGAAVVGLFGTQRYEYLLNPMGPMRKAMDLSRGQRSAP